MVNKKKYIGQCKYLKRDKRTVRNWETYLGSGKALRRAIKKYGPENFSRQILCECFTTDDLNYIEELLITEYDAVNDPNFYNISLKAHSTHGFQGRHHTEEHKKYMSDKYRANHPNKGKHWSPEIRKNMSNAQKARPKIPYPPERIERIRNLGLANKGKKWSEETRNRIMQSRGKTWILSNLITGEVIEITNLKKWSRETGFPLSAIKGTLKRDTTTREGWKLKIK